MDTSYVMEIFRESIILVMQLVGPILLASVVIGLIIAIFQAATQIHEQTLTFAPKLLVVGVILLLGGSYMVNVLTDFIKLLFDKMLY